MPRDTKAPVALVQTFGDRRRADDSSSGVRRRVRGTMANADTDSLRALTGLFTAHDVVKSARTTFTNSMINDLPTPTSPAPNSVIVLPGADNGTLNDQALHAGVRVVRASAVATGRSITQTNLLASPWVAPYAPHAPHARHKPS